MVPMDYQRRRRIRSRQSQQSGGSNSMSVAKNRTLSKNNSHSHPQGCFVCAIPIHHTASSRRFSLSLSFAVQDSRPMGLTFNSKKTLILGRHAPALRVSIGSAIIVKSAMLQLIDKLLCSPFSILFGLPWYHPRCKRASLILVQLLLLNQLVPSQSSMTITSSPSAASPNWLF